MRDTVSVLRDSLLRRTPVRLALAITVLVVVAYLLAAATTYALMRSELIRRQDQRINDVFSLITANTDTGSPPDYVEAVNAQIEAARGGPRVFQLRGPDGAVLAGNIPPVSLPLGWSDQNPKLFGRPGDVRFRVRVGRIGADQLLVGLDYSDVDALRETIQTAMLWSSLFALLAAVGGGSFIALRVRRRLSQVKLTLDRVASGDLTARLPLSGADDDIDRVSLQVNSTLTRLASVVDGMRQVSADIAHDLRTPLNRLRMRVSEALDATERGEDPRASLEAALTESDAIGNTFSALLRIAQIEAGARRERFSPVDLARTLGSVVEVYADVAEDAGMVLEADGLEHPAWIRGDAELLVQGFANLIENSIRHCPAGTTIRASLDLSGPLAIVRLADDGPGIPAEERELVLQRLYRLQRSRTTPGSGLGLSLVKAVTDLHGAALSLSDAGPGLEVRITFTKSTSP